MPEEKRFKVAILWRGDLQARRNATPENNRFHRIFEELAAVGIRAEPAVYDEDFADEVREQLLGADGVLVWVDPIHQDKTREALDPLLRDVASRGPWVSAHPDVILKMGVKEVLYRTKHLGWGTDTHLYRGAAEFRQAFPARLQAGPRVLKQNRGNGGQGVWKVELVDEAGGTDLLVWVLHAQRGSVPEELPLARFMSRCESYFGWGGCIIDQPFQPRLPDGMIRCYMGADRVAGFGHQYHARSRCRTVSGTAHENGNRMGAADDRHTRSRCGGAADHLGRRFPLRPTRCGGGRQLRPLRDQYQLVLRDPGPGAGGDREAGAGPESPHINVTHG
jgi:hypothetical protein